MCPDQVSRHVHTSTVKLILPLILPPPTHISVPPSPIHALLPCFPPHVCTAHPCVYVNANCCIHIGFCDALQKALTPASPWTIPRSNSFSKIRGRHVHQEILSFSIAASRVRTGRVPEKRNIYAGWKDPCQASAYSPSPFCFYPRMHAKSVFYSVLV